MTAHDESRDERGAGGGPGVYTRGTVLKRGALAVAGLALVGPPLAQAASARPFITRKRISLNLWTWAWVTSLPNVKGDPAKAAFERAFPNVDLSVKVFAYPDYLTALKTGVPSGTAGDVIAVPTIAVGRQYARFLQPLDPFVAADLPKNWQKPFLPGTIDAVKKWDSGGKLLGLPVWASVGGIVWYSQKAFQKAGIQVPKNYDELKQQAPKLKAVGIAPLAWGAKDQWPNPDNLIVFASQFKPGVVAAAEQGRTTFTDPAIVSALAFMAQSIKDGIYNDDPFSTTAFPDGYINQFGGGKAAMVMGGTWFFNVALSIPGATQDWRAFLFPHIPSAPQSNWLGSRPGGDPVSTGPGPSRPWRTINLAYSIPMSTKGDKAKAAWSFVDYQASRQGQQLNAGWISPSRSDVALHRVDKGFVDMLAWQGSLFGDAEQRDFLYADVQDAVQNAIADVCVNGTNPKTALGRVDDVAKRARARNKA